MSRMTEKINYFYFIAIAFALPFVSSAQIAEDSATTDLHDFGWDIVKFINNTLVPFVFAVSLMLFIYGIYLHFFHNKGDEDGVKYGRQYMIWAIMAFVMMISVWGIVNLIAGGLGTDKAVLDRSLIPKEDFK